MQIHGTIKEVSAVQNVTDKFSKREFVLETENNTPYPQHIKMEMQQAHCLILDKFKEGDEVSVDFSLRGRQYPDKNDATKMNTFNTIVAWKMDMVNAASPTVNSQNTNNQSTNQGIVTGNGSDKKDPF